MPQWTDEQKTAITARGENLLLAAAAGSGKTTVMVERILSLIGDGVGIDRMLIVTFTRASAADMRAKLTNKLTELADSGDEHSREQLARLESASISTIHSFCTSLLRTHFEAAGVDPAFRILDDTENKLCEEYAVNEAMEAAYERMDEPLIHLNFGRGPKKVRELAVELYHIVSDRPDPDGWMDEMLAMAEGDGNQWFDVLARVAEDDIRRAIAFCKSAVRQAQKPDGAPYYVEALMSDIAELSLMLGLGFDSMRAKLTGFQFTRFSAPRKSKTYTPSEEEMVSRQTVQAIREKGKKALAKACDDLVFDKERSIMDMHEDAVCLRALCGIVRDIAKKHAARKAEKNALTFSDLEHKSLELLRRPEIAESARQKYEYVFVDEYQDTSDVQEELVTAVSRENNRFMVGDVKQSIYRFRQAEPALFLKKYKEYGAGEGGRLIALTRNFRSRSSILTLTNKVFERTMQGGTAEIEYDELARLNPGVQFEGEDPPVEIHLISKKPLNEETDDKADGPADDIEELKHIDREAMLVVRRIRELMEKDPDLHYKDIAVLSRAGSSVIPAMLTMLLDAGIPAYAEGSAGYFETMEVQVFLSYLSLIENHRRDEALIAVLRSIMHRVTSAELALIRAETKEGSFYDAVREYAKHNNELGKKLARFLTDLENDRTLSRSMPLPRLFAEILMRTGFADALLALPGGKQRCANIDRLSSRAASYEVNQSGGLTGFLRYAERMRMQGDDEVAHIMGEADDVVRLMTVHKSKGLEFPVVFGVNLGKSYKQKDFSAATITAHPALGAGMAHVDERLSTRRDTIAKLAINRKKQEENRAEELRVLYVMLTRAKHRLILVGGVRNAATAMDTWRIAVDEPSIYESSLDVIMPALMACPGGEEAVALDGIGRLRLDDTDVIVTWQEESKVSYPVQTEGRKRSSVAEDLLMAADGMYLPEIRNEELKSAMFWKYPREADVKKPIKLTATGLQRDIEGPDVIPDLAERPKFMTEEGLTGAEKGSAVHAALQNLDYEPLRRAAPVRTNLLGEAIKDESRVSYAVLRKELSRQLDSMRDIGILSLTQRDAVPEHAVTVFFLDTIGRRILRAETVHREWSFNLRMSVEDALTEADRETYAGAMVLVQGTIDLCFMEDGQWVLVDYKTDKNTDLEEIKAHYRGQLALYAKALERITGIPVKERLLCLLRRGLVIPMGEE